ncbi:MAG: DUF5103 domain-containing protein [Chitinophagales bacterium]
MKLNITLALLFLCFSSIANALDIYEDKVHEDNIHTATLHPIGYPFATPIIQMNTQDVLLLEFDELGEDVSDFRYVIVQCNYKWEPTNNSVFDFIDGFSDGYINNYDFSFNTTVDYVHYQMTIPNEDFRITQSGNYVVVVFRDSESEPSLVKRFMVADSKVQIQNPAVAITRNPSLRDQLQEILFSLDHEGFNIVNPFQEITVVVRQNDRWDNAISDIKPLHIRENSLSFNYNLKIAFPPAKEYREFDIRSLRYRTERVRAIDVRDSINIVYLMPDGMRQLEEYRYEGDGDLNGKFLIDVQEGRNEDLEADYVQVNFSLPFDNKISNGYFYVVGEFNNYEISDKNKLKFNDFHNAYEAKILLKQGFYNYQYVFVPNDNPKVKDYTLTEGNYYDTENDYAIYVYYRSFGQRYDELIGFSFINSRLNRY